MADMDHAEVEQRLWKAISDDRIGMLGMTEGGHFQPMQSYHEQETHTLWFYSYADNKLSGNLGEGQSKPAMFNLVTKDRKVWACLAGDLSLDNDRSRIEKFWDADAQAWFPGGKEDSKLTMLRFAPREAEVWINDKGLVRYGLEKLKANLSESKPDVGVHQTVQLG